MQLFAVAPRASAKDFGLQHRTGAMPYLGVTLSATLAHSRVLPRLLPSSSVSSSYFFPSTDPLLLPLPPPPPPRRLYPAPSVGALRNRVLELARQGDVWEEEETSSCRGVILCTWLSRESFACCLSSPLRRILLFSAPSCRPILRTRGPGPPGSSEAQVGEARVAQVARVLNWTGLLIR